MLSLSHTTGYAILALACLEGAGGRWVLSTEIAELTGTPRPYLSRVLHTLRRSGLVRAKRGYRGGFALARPAGGISMLDVAEAIEGKRWMPCCLLGMMGIAADMACPTQGFWNRELAKIKDKLGKTTLVDVAEYARQSGALQTDAGGPRHAQAKPAAPGGGRAKHKARSPRRSATRNPGSAGRRS
ncbi:MAG: RrF2 family transcriptional regulator [Planctomycetota bacterium]|jgi:Rrf2 family protein